ncbi:hypothetical protein [Isachenkonia alkalipeptolytica]|uniref:Uncharacterized protein n=1 Tax=Isachenkonia alkalipeptolytica TaxID=2565777 RepID=A0AA43XLX9_9CLOT|nr:hypothetical protein [Isachenkonia alkalipeptolytica]NBG88355.1 hypothetical protein [Isachenkonia alkalipeptolytica]
MQKGLFQYIGDSFKILFNNRILLFAGVMEVLLTGMLLIMTFGGALGGPRTSLFTIISLVAIMGLVASFMLAGKIYMIKKVYDPDEEEPVEVADYFEGMKHFGFKVFGGSMFLIVCVLLVFVPLVYVLARTGSVFLIILATIALAVALVFVTLWDTILVVDDIDVASAYGDSISFVKANFWVVLGLNIFAGFITAGDLLDPAGAVGNGQEAGVNVAVDLSFLYQWIINTFGAAGWIISLLLLLVLSVIATMVFVDLYMDRRDRYGSFS